MLRRLGLQIFVIAMLFSVATKVFLAYDASQDRKDKLSSLVEAGHYSPAVEASYLSACEAKSGDPIYCQCTLTRLAASYSEAEFLELDNAVQRNPKALPKKVVRIFRNCPHFSGSNGPGTQVTQGG